jgi:hypothetical protein
MSVAAPIAERIFDANGEVLLFDVRGLGAVGLQLAGTFTLTVQFEATVDGETFVGLNMLPSNSATAVSSTTAAGAWRANVAGYRLVRARVSAFTSGSANATFLAASTGGAH